MDAGRLEELRAVYDAAVRAVEIHEIAREKKGLGPEELRAGAWTPPRLALHREPELAEGMMEWVTQEFRRGVYEGVQLPDRRTVGRWLSAGGFGLEQARRSGA